MSKAVLTAPLERSTRPYQWSLLSFSMRSRSSILSCASSSMDLMVAVSCGLTSQIYLIIALSFPCRPWRQGFVTGQVSQAWSIALRTHVLYTQPCVLKERWREERTGFSSLTSSRRFSHVLWLKARNQRLLRACLLGSKRKLPPPVCQARLGLLSVVWHLRGGCSLAPCTPVVRVLCQVLEPTALLMHPVLTAFAEDAVAAHSSATDSTWELA